MMFSGFGVLGGMIAAALMIWCQQTFGIVEIPGDTFVVSAYPMDMEIEDFFLVFFTVMLISILSSWYPAMSATKKQLSLKGQY
jgi:ABC-type lipoprotein release transport system permease subunit